jgi:hypothetical protein
MEFSLDPAEPAEPLIRSGGNIRPLQLLWGEGSVSGTEREKGGNMKKFLLASATAFMAFGGLALSGGAQAAPMSVDPMRDAVQSLNMTQDAQYFYRGRRYCFYPDGWRGPGFYWCGYAWRRGYGWGGGRGWRGWDGGGDGGARIYRREVRPRYDYDRREGGRGGERMMRQDGGDRMRQRGGDQMQQRGGRGGQQQMAPTQQRGGGGEQRGGGGGGQQRGGGGGEQRGGGGGGGGAAPGGGAGGGGEQTQGITH